MYRPASAHLRFYFLYMWIFSKTNKQQDGSESKNRIAPFALRALHELKYNTLDDDANDENAENEDF